MSLEEMVSKYIVSAEHVLGTILIVESPMNLDKNCVKEVVEFAKAYLEDAKHYRKEKRFEVSLASVAYCEGLLDALRLLGVVKFEWPTRKDEKKEK